METKANEDWTFAGGNKERTNVSKSKSELAPPFRLYWEFDADGGLAKNCLSVSDAILFASTLNGDVFAIDITSGRSLGRISTFGRSSYSTPLIYNNSIILASSDERTNYVFRYNLVQGLIKWKKNAGPVESSPVQDSNFVIVSSLNGKIYKLDIISGNLIWVTKPASKYHGSFYTSPTIYNDTIVAGNTDGCMYAFDLTYGKELWHFKTDASIYSDASYMNGNIYFGSDDKNFYCINSQGKLKWKKDLNTKFLSSPTFYKGKVIVSGIDGYVYALDSSDGNIEWTFRTKGAIWASPLCHGDLIFIGSFDRYFYCINAEDGNVLWSHFCEGRIKTGAVIWKDYIFVGGDDKYIYCFSNHRKQEKSSGKLSDQ